MPISKPIERPLLLCLLASALLHCALILSGFSWTKVASKQEILTEVVLLPPRVKDKSQIVPESSRPSRQKNLVTKQLAEKDSFTLKQKLRRGDEESLGDEATSEKPVATQKNLKEVKHKPEKKVLKAKKKILAKGNFSLKLKPSYDRLELSPKPSKTPDKKSKLNDKVRQNNFKQAKPFRRLSLTSPSLGRFGSSAHLPNIPDGQITFLNAKADKHAVFVRRVALQVFGKLKRLSWAELSFGEVSKIRGFVKVHAVMSSHGKLLSVNIQDSSGLNKFDSSLQSAAKQGTWDQNPPETAKADDGNIHFIFQARTWSRKIGDAALEKRWLLMGTGLL